MRSFKYSATNTLGTTVNGIVEANDRDEAMRQLRTAFPIVVSIEQVSSDKKSILNAEIGGGKIKTKNLSMSFNQFAILLGAGLPIVRTIRMVSEQTSDKTLKELFKNVGNDVAAGHGLADSLSNQKVKLSPTVIETIRAGEVSGNLGEVFQKLHVYLDKTSKNKASVVSAMIYPALVIAVAIVVIIIIMTVAVPAFTTSFAESGTDLPAITQGLINTSDFFINYWIVLLSALAIIIIALFAFKRTERGKTSLANLALNIPLVGKVNQMNGAAQYASTMSLMIASGLSMIDAVEVTARSMSNAVMKNKLTSVVPDLQSGKRLGSSLAKRDVFPELLCEMTTVGEETGSLESTLNIIGEYYDNEVNTATSRALSILEPTIILFLAGIVVLVLLAVYLPMFSLYGSVG